MSLFCIFNGSEQANFSIASFYKGLHSKGNSIFIDKNWSKSFPKSMKSNKFDIFDEKTVFEILKKRSKSATTVKKLQSISAGSFCNLFKTSLESSLFAYKLTDVDVEFIRTLDIKYNELEEVNIKIEQLIPVELINKKKELEKELKSLKK